MKFLVIYFVVVECSVLKKIGKFKIFIGMFKTGVVRFYYFDNEIFKMEFLFLDFSATKVGGLKNFL